MAYFIGEGGLSTWMQLRAIATVSAAYPTPPPAPIITDHNQEWPASVAYLKTIEGNGLLRVGPPYSNPNGFYFTANTPPIDDFFFAEAFSDPTPEQLVGRTVTTAGSTFTITAAMFTGGEPVGSGGGPPLSVEWFEALT